jgi:hemerythrin-like domain-containing protein
MEEVIATLCACHREIERALTCLIRIAKGASGSPLSDPKSFSEALRFFRVVVPEHSAAEEETVFPRLRPAIEPELVRLLDTLEEEHGCADRAHDEADRLGRLWLANGQLSPAQTTRLMVDLEALVGLYDRHIRLEERDVFPLLKLTQ